MASSVKPFAEGMEILYFVGCYLSYDPRMKKVAVATAKILNTGRGRLRHPGRPRRAAAARASARRADEEVFRSLAKENIKTFIDRGVKKILVSSPHCYHTFKNEYPEFMVNFEVVHISQYLRELIEAGQARAHQRRTARK